MIYQNEEYINNLVDKYKDINSDKLRNEVINSFKPYFQKYAKIFCSRGAVNLSNKDTITFFRLFMSKEERLTAKSCMYAAEKYLSVLRKVFIDYTQEDMYNEILIFFLEALNKYKPMIADHKRSRERISFTHYIQVNLRFKIYRLCSKKSKDALSGGGNVPYSEVAYSRPGKIEPDHQNIDLDWVYKGVAGDVFECLTETERFILWLKYESHPRGLVLSSKQISNRVGLHYKTIQQRMEKIRNKLEEII